MHLDPIITPLCGIVVIVLLVAFALRKLNQPHVVAFILGGVLVGPHGLALVEDVDTMSHLGSVGVVLLLFFVGMEVDVPALIRGWRLPVLGTALQIGVSVAALFAVGIPLGWPLPRIVLLGFVISLSSTAVVLQLLRERRELDSDLGRDITGILLVQDLALIPMLVILSFLGTDAPTIGSLVLQALGILLIVLLSLWVFKRRELPRVLRQIVERDEESRFLVGLLLCFGLAFVTGLTGLSTALGAFVAGIFANATRQTRWIHHSLGPFRMLFVGAFFVSIGMMIDIEFLREYWFSVGLLVLLVFGTNTIINTAILRGLGEPWTESIYAAAMLAQIGELSFLLAAIGVQAGIIADFAYQSTVATIAITLTLSPAWIALAHRLGGPAGIEGPAANLR